jgi:hypothetical protein
MQLSLFHLLFLVPKAPAAAVMYLESLTKYLRGIHTHANDEIVLVQSPQNHASESHIAHLNTMPKLGKLHHQPIYTSTLI